MTVTVTTSDNGSDSVCDSDNDSTCDSDSYLRARHLDTSVQSGPVAPPSQHMTQVTVRSVPAPHKTPHSNALQLRCCKHLTLIFELSLV